MANLNPGRLKLELFCKGARADDSCDFEHDTRPVKRTRGGLGSGLDAIIFDKTWVNIPIAEPFAQESPYLISKENGKYILSVKEAVGDSAFVTELCLPSRPDWYDQTTSSGKRIGDIGVMQGTYFAVYPSDLCGFWKDEPRRSCRFCSIGLCHGKTESEEKTVDDVLEAVKAAIKHERITFVHFNTGFYADDKSLDVIMPYVEAVKKETKLLVGVQCPPAIDLAKYDRLKKAGANHVSFCYEIFSPQHFKEICPGKSEYFGNEVKKMKADVLLNDIRNLAGQFLEGKQPDDGQLIFYRALAYCSTLWRKGQVSGEIITGLEPVESTLAAIDFNAKLGAVSTVCVFRPCIETDLENTPVPEPDSIASVFARMYEACVENKIPFGIAPNIRTAMVHLPEEGKYLSEKIYPAITRCMTNVRQNFFKAGFRSMFALSRLV